MISLESFIKGIHSAIMSANEALMQKNSSLLKTFFEPVMGEDPIQGQIGNVRQPGQRKVGGRTVTVKNIFNSRAKPKCIVIQYPKHTANGIELVDVEVPLITLVPVGLSRVEKVKINMDVVLSLDKDGKVNIGFEKPKKKRRPLFRRPVKQTPSKVGHIDITIAPHEGSDGLKLLIEKYEKVLKAEIPN